MEYYGNTLCISAPELVGNGIMSQSNYQKMVTRGRIDVARRGGGASGCTALIAVDSLPTKYLDKVKEQFPGGPEVRLQGWVTSNYEVDQRAIAFFSNPRQTNLDLTPEKIQEYVVNASVLNCCIKLYDRASSYRKLMGEKYDWNMMTGVVKILKDVYHHTLPESTLRFRKKVNEYRQGGYAALISGKFGNQNKRKVDLKLEKLVLGLWCLPNKPYGAQVRDLYESFLCGELDAYDVKTGELFSPNDFTDKNGEPITLSDTTIRNILNKPSNRAIWDKSQLSWSSFMHESMPHMHRHAGEYSLSQITMDDVDLTRKLKDTKLRVKAYYAYDSVSQCVLGASYSRNKDPQLVRECFREMFRLIAKHGWGIPAGIEVENHLMTEYKYSLLQEGTVFTHVRYCAPLNSQEKQAENFNGAKKKSVIHRNHTGIGRFYGKWQWRAEARKVSDASNDTWEDKEYFSFEELVADDRRDNYEWNHALHPDQKRFKGMTRWDVLMERINPNLRPYDEITLARYIGEKVETSVRRNSTVRVAYEDWWLSSYEALEKLAPNNYKVTAYYLPDEDGKPQNVFIFQGDRYIDQVERVETYNRVMAEQTDDDKRKFYRQQKKVRQFMKFVNKGVEETPTIGIQKKLNLNDIDNETETEITPQGPAMQEAPKEPPGMGAAAPDVPDEAERVLQHAGCRQARPNAKERQQGICKNERSFGTDKKNLGTVGKDADRTNGRPFMHETVPKTPMGQDEALSDILALMEDSPDEATLRAQAIADI